MVTVTKNQEIVYDIIVKFKLEHDGNAPSLQTISYIAKKNGTPLSGQTAMNCIRAMPELIFRGEGGLEVAYGDWTIVDEPEIVVESV